MAIGAKIDRERANERDVRSEADLAGEQQQLPFSTTSARRCLCSRRVQIESSTSSHYSRLSQSALQQPLMGSTTVESTTVESTDGVKLHKRLFKAAVPAPENLDVALVHPYRVLGGFERLLRRSPLD